jgi:hypothetical protein
MKGKNNNTPFAIPMSGMIQVATFRMLFCLTHIQIRAKIKYKIQAFHLQLSQCHMGKNDMFLRHLPTKRSLPSFVKIRNHI